MPVPSHVPFRLRNGHVADLNLKISLLESTPGVSAQRKEKVPFKIFYAKRIYLSLELQIIKTNPRLIRINNIPLWSVGSNRELFAEKKFRTTTALELDLLVRDCEFTLYRAKNLHSYGCEMILYARVGGNPSKKNPRKLERTFGRFGAY